MKITKNKSGKWMIDFTCRGRRIRKVVGESKREAEAVAAAIKTDILRGEYRLPRQRSRLVFRKIAERYLNEYSKKKKRSWERDKYSLKHLNQYFGNKPLTDIKRKHILYYMSSRSEEKASGATINREVACLKHIFTMAMEWDLVESNPVRGVKMNPEKEKMRVLNRTEIENLIDAAKGDLKQILIIALNTGMRMNEILSLNWSEVDFKNSAITVLAEKSKSKKSRKVPMNQAVKNAMQSFVGRHGDIVFFNPRTGRRMKSIRTAFENALKTAGIEDFRFHDLRHTAATYMTNAGIPVTVASEILGHSSLAMTMKYVHPDDDIKLRAAEILEDEYAKKPRHFLVSRPSVPKNKVPVTTLNQYN